MIWLVLGILLRAAGVACGGDRRQCRLAICARGDVARGAKCPVRCGLVGGTGSPVVWFRAQGGGGMECYRPVRSSVLVAS